MATNSYRPKTYPGMNAQIIELLEMSASPVHRYAAERIRELEATLSRAKKFIGHIDIDPGFFDTTEQEATLREIDLTLEGTTLPPYNIED